MAKASTDFAALERAYRLRAPAADDALLKQVFGEEALAALQANRPELIETARAYFPHLTSSTCDRLSREAEALQAEKVRCQREMEQLAVRNYGAFIGSAKVTRAVRQEVVDVQKQLGEMAAAFGPMQEDIREFQQSSAGLVARRAALRNVLQQHGALLELLELPQLLDACVRNQMYEESLELLAHCSSMLQSHDARGEEIPVLTMLKEQIAVQRANLQTSLMAQLSTDIHLPQCVKVIGFLRRAHRYTEDELRNTFITQRSVFLDRHKQQVELLRGTRGSVVTALKNAADLLRTHVYDIGTQYQALFQQDGGPLVPWLNEQIAWFTGLLQAHVLPDRAPGAAGGPRTSAPSPAGAGRGGAAVGVRIDAASLMTVLRQSAHASTALKRLGGHFFPAVQGIFDLRLEFHLCEMLDTALLNFHSELGRYDWVPSTALTSASAATAAAAVVAAAGEASGGAAASGWLHPQALDLTRHRPLAVLTNDLIQVFNELRQCPLHALRAAATTQLFECMSAALNVLRSVKQSSPILQGTAPKASEFTRLCRHFAEIFVPLMDSHLETIFGSAARLDTQALVDSMVPDLLPIEEAQPLPTSMGDGEPSVAAAQPPPVPGPPSHADVATPAGLAEVPARTATAASVAPGVPAAAHSVPQAPPVATAFSSGIATSVTPPPAATPPSAATPAPPAATSPLAPAAVSEATAGYPSSSVAGLAPPPPQPAAAAIPAPSGGDISAVFGDSDGWPIG